MKATIKVRATETVDSINPLVFGQQIEFMGACIDGGVWGELLRNRKFGLPDSGVAGISDEWQPVRGKGQANFSIDTENPYCGTQSQRIEVYSVPETPQAVSTEDAIMPVFSMAARKNLPLRAPGLRQDDVPVVFNQDYVGYVWLRGEGHSGERDSPTLDSSRSDSPGSRSDSPSVHVGFARGNDPFYVSVDLGPISSEWQKYEFRLKSPIDDAQAGFQLHVVGKGKVWFGPVSLMAAEHEQGMTRGVLDLLRRSEPPHMRWPGGCYADFYFIEQAIGPRDKRPMTLDPMWQDWCPNDFGTDEFMAFCRAVGAEPSITLNIRTGTASDAANWVEYCNGDASTTWGKRRAENGHPEPYNVKYWSLGNESWFYYTAEEYAEKAIELAKAVKAVDPNVVLCAVGRGIEWNVTVAERAGQYFDWISEHHYFPHSWDGELGREEEMTEDVFFRPYVLEEYLDELRTALDNVGEKLGKRIEITLDEWNSWPPNGLIPPIFGPEVEKDILTPLRGLIHTLDCNYTLRQGIHVCAMFHLFFRLGRNLAGANVWSSCNESGITRTNGVQTYATPEHLAFELYRNHSGSRTVACEVDCPEVTVRERPSGKKAPWLDVVATRGDDGRLFVHVINKHQHESIQGDFICDGISGKTCTAHVLSADSWRARNSFEVPEHVCLRAEQLTIDGNRLRYCIPPHTAVTLEVS